MATPNPPGETVSGRIERITFVNDENGYTVLTVKAAGRKNLITAAGRLPDPVVGQFIEMEGAFANHPRFGPRFEIRKARLAPPTTLPSLKKYLASGLIKGLGPVLAGRLVDRFGAGTLDILAHNPERLTEVEGLGAARREMIIEGWNRTVNAKRLLEFLAEFGLGLSAALRIIRRLGEKAEELIREDPYRLAYEVDGVGFVTADKVARAVGFAPDAPARLEAGLLFTLNETGADGHVFYPENLLLKESAALLPEASPDDLKTALGRLILAGRVKAEPGDEPGAARIYAPYLQRAENWVASDIVSILHHPPRLIVPRPQKALAWAEEQLGLELSPDQRRAAEAAVTKKILIITGGPGSGKTTIARLITAIYAAVKAKIALTAPTGRAAKRLSQATGLPAKTVHRLLEYSPQAGGFLRGPKNKLDIDLLLADETSMIDLNLMNHLLGAVPHHAAVIFIGDQDQLPSVGPGRVLADLTASGLVEVAALTEAHRQASGSQIIRAARRINAGLFPESSRDRDDGDFYFIEENDPGRIIDKMLYLIAKKLPEKLGVNPMEDIQVLTPMHNGELGAENLNAVLSAALNPGGQAALRRFGRQYKTGDRVMQLKNNYNRDVFNGDGGRVEKIDFEAQEMTVNFEGRPVTYDFSDLDELALAYAITIHKSQGSEFPVTLIPVVPGHHIMLRRKLIYTAVTRGRRFVVLIGSARALRGAVDNNHEQNRYSRLADKLAGR
ncbi:MAG: ATP-dependent RecD-like DNA helicase [Candidatus Adiutrix sp.]|nr:ATP-dependent RecD-like DNA helicase [Candidatus Adiutrix sp.]